MYRDAWQASVYRLCSNEDRIFSPRACICLTLHCCYFKRYLKTKVSRSDPISSICTTAGSPQTGTDAMPSLSSASGRRINSVTPPRLYVCRPTVYAAPPTAEQSSNELDDLRFVPRHAVPEPCNKFDCTKATDAWSVVLSGGMGGEYN